MLIVYNADMSDLPDGSLKQLLDRACLQKTNKFILEMNEVSPKMHHRLLASGARSVQFNTLTDKDLNAIMQFLIAEQPEERQPGLPAILSGTGFDATIETDLIRRSQGDATRLEQNLRFSSDSKDSASHPMVDTSKILNLSSVIGDNWFACHASNALTTWVEGNLAGNVRSNANNNGSDCQRLDAIATFYEDIATYDMMKLNDHHHSMGWDGSGNLTLLGDELVARRAHNTMKKVGPITNPKLHGYVPTEADKQVQLSYRVSRGNSDSKTLPSSEDLRQSYSPPPYVVAATIDPALPEAKRHKVTHSYHEGDSSLSIATIESGLRDTDVMIFANTSLQDACDILVPYASRPREIVQCRGFSSALVLKAPRPHPHGQGHDSTAMSVSGASDFRDLLKHFDEKDDRIDKMKNLHF